MRFQVGSTLMTSNTYSSREVSGWKYSHEHYIYIHGIKKVTIDILRLAFRSSSTPYYA